jgi:hypothetical protein
MYFVLIIFIWIFLSFGTNHLSFHYFLWGNSLWYTSALDYEHVSGTNYARKPRYHCIFHLWVLQYYSSISISASYQMLSKCFFDKQLQRTYARVKLSKEVAPLGAQIKPSHGNCPCCFRIHGQTYRLVSPPYLNGANKPGHGQLKIFCSTEATAKRLANQLNQGCMSARRDAARS